MARLSPRSGADTNRTSTAADGAGPDSGPWRALLLVLGITALAYLAIRWYREGAERVADRLPDPVVDEAEAVLEGAQLIEIGTPGEETTDGQSPPDDGETERLERPDDGEREGEPSLDAVSTTDRSAEEIAEQADPNVQREPAEPGTMTVEKEIADDVIDGLEADEAEDERADGDDNTGDEGEGDEGEGDVRDDSAARETEANDVDGTTDERRTGGADDTDEERCE